ncbi:MAG TPA: hypothetical protein VG501_01650, partial [Rhizomicrobium sp.]|nr:hypothetical protein [Rhizomicrobium sp.]
GTRNAILVPEALIATRAGIDYARVWTAEGVMDVPVQTGPEHVTPGKPAEMEILSGLSAGDRLLKP